MGRLVWAESPSPALQCDHQPYWWARDPRESSVKDFGMLICTHSLGNMGTPTQVSEENKNPFLKLPSADTNSDP